MHKFPGCSPVLGKKDMGEERNKTSVLHGRRYIAHPAFLFWNGDRARASGTLSMPKELHHQPPALKATPAKITELHNCHSRKPERTQVI